MRENNYFEIADVIKNSLGLKSQEGLGLSCDIVKDNVLKAAHMLGYGEPFDKEQKHLNQMLIDARASKTDCYSAWAYYFDRKMIEAKKRA